MISIILNSLKTAFAFLLKHWKYVLAFIFIPLAIYIYRIMFKSSINGTTAKEQFNKWWVINIVGKNYVTSKSSDKLFDNAKLLAIYLGTFKGATQNTEDEDSAVALLLQHRFADFTCLEYAYNKYHTDNRDLTADLHSYLSSGDYSEVSVVIFDTNLGGKNMNSFAPIQDEPKPNYSSEGEPYTPIWSPPPPQEPLNVWANASNY